MAAHTEAAQLGWICMGGGRRARAVAIAAGGVGGI